jgi:hypothetical protein
MTKLKKYIKHLFGIHLAQKRWHKHYHPHKNSNWYWHWTVDFILLLLIILLGILNFQLYSQNKNWHDIIWNNYNPMNTNSGQGVLNTKIDIQLTSDNQNIEIGKDIKYNLEITNNNSFDLDNISIIINTNVGNIIAPQLERLSKGQTKNIQFTITNTNKDSILSTIATITYKDTENGTKGFTVSNKLVQRAETIFEIQAFARYYTNEGDQLGLGPVPPQVNIPTRYWIIINPKTSNNSIADFKLVAQLPNNVSLTGRTSTTAPKNIIYQENNHQIVWQLDSIAPQEGFFGAAFEIEITPTKDLVGQTAPLLQSLKATALDSITGRVFNLNLSNITTDLVNDKLEESSGIITY